MTGLRNEDRRGVPRTGHDEVAEQARNQQRLPGDGATPPETVDPSRRGPTEPPRTPGPMGTQPLATELLGDPEADDVGSGAARGGAGGATLGLLAGGVIGALPGAVAGAAVGAAAEAAEPDDATDRAPRSEAGDPARRRDTPPPLDRVTRTTYGHSLQVERHPNPTDR